MQFLSTQNSLSAPVFIWGEDKTHNDSAQKLFDEIKSLTNQDFSLATFEVSSWNAQFSPWSASAVFGKEDFSGKGNETLKYLEEIVVLEIKEKFPESPIFLLGYSLAGLFSLWSLYESQKFDGAVCCSSSLWFENWDEYVSSHKIQKPFSKIYLSLGNREEKTKNRTMSKVGERTRIQAELLKNDKNVKSTILEWNEGGHFDEPIKRMAKGVKWMLENL